MVLLHRVSVLAQYRLHSPLSLAVADAAHDVGVLESGFVGNGEGNWRVKEFEERRPLEIGLQ